MNDRVKYQPTEVELLALQLWAHDNPGCVHLIADFRDIANRKQKEYIERAKQELSGRIHGRT